MCRHFGPCFKNGPVCDQFISQELSSSNWPTTDKTYIRRKKKKIQCGTNKSLSDYSQIKAIKMSGHENVTLHLKTITKNKMHFHALDNNNKKRHLS